MTAILLITLQKNSICIQKNEDLPLIRELKKNKLTTPQFQKQSSRGIP